MARRKTSGLEAVAVAALAIGGGVAAVTVLGALLHSTNRRRNYPRDKARTVK